MKYIAKITKRIVYKSSVKGFRKILGTLGLYDPLTLGQMDVNTLDELDNK